MWRRQLRTVSALLVGQLLLCQPHPALLAEQITDRRAAEQTSRKDGVHFILHACAGPHEPRTPGDPPAQRVVASSGTTLL